MTVGRQLELMEMEYNRVSTMLEALKEGVASIQVKALYDTLLITDIFPHYKEKLIRDMETYKEELEKQYQKIKEAVSC